MVGILQNLSEIRYNITQIPIEGSILINNKKTNCKYHKITFKSKPDNTHRYITNNFQQNTDLHGCKHSIAHQLYLQLNIPVPLTLFMPNSNKHMTMEIEYSFNLIFLFTICAFVFTYYDRYTILTFYTICVQYFVS